MSGRVVLTLFAACLSTGACFSQLSNPFPDGEGRSGFGHQIHVTSVSGTVIGATGVPIADAHVELRDEQTGRSIASGYTNASGSFEFDNLPAAAYDVVASKGLAEGHEHLMTSDAGIHLRITLNNSDAAAAQADGNNTVSVAEYKVPQKAREALHKAQEALAKNRHDEAVKQLAKSIEIYPEYAPALTLRGVLSLDGNQIQSAIDDFDKAIHSDPGFALAYTGMAAALNQLQKFDEAIRSAGRAITLAPRSWQSYFEMAKSYLGKGDDRDALSQLAKAQESMPTDYAPIHLLRAQALLALQNYNDAVTELQAFLTMAPQDPNADAARRALEKTKAFMATAVKPQVASSAR